MSDQNKSSSPQMLFNYHSFAVSYNYPNLVASGYYADGDEDYGQSEEKQLNKKSQHKVMLPDMIALNAKHFHNMQSLIVR
jgi:hypothetical protein